MDLAKLIEGAARFGASDIHMIEDAPPCFRVDGSIVPVNERAPTRAEMEDMLRSTMPPGLAEILQSRRSADFSHQHKDVARCRVAAFYERQKLRVVFRLIPTKIPTVDELGLSPTLKTFKDYHFGMVLVNGPTGSGKSTTLAAIIGDINATLKGTIITIEDPIEFLHPNKKCVIAQREVRQDVLDFNDGLVQAMRQDPDVILVGEMRDRDTMRTGIRAAETGHLVFSTLHTTSAIQTIERIIGTFPPDEHTLLRDQLSTNLRAVLTQALVRRTEGKGRIAAQEILICNMTVGKLIRENRLSDIRGIMQGGEGGMQVFDQALAKLVREKKITEAEGMRHAHDEFAFRRYVKGVSSSNDRGGIIGGFSG